MVKIINTINLLAKAQSGCQSALNQLAADVCSKVYPVLLRMTGDEELSRDLLQETLLVMLRYVKNLEQIEEFWGWIHTVAKSRVYDYFRKKHHREITGSMDFDDVSAINNTPALKMIVDNEMKEQLVVAIGNLRKRHRDVVHLRHFENRSYAEIASLSGCTPQQARIRFFRAKKSLQSRLCAADFGMD